MYRTQWREHLILFTSFLLSESLNIYKSFMKMKNEIRKDIYGFLLELRKSQCISKNVFELLLNFEPYFYHDIPYQYFFSLALTGDKIDCICNWHNCSFPPARQGTFNNYDYWHQWTASGEFHFFFLLWHPVRKSLKLLPSRIKTSENETNFQYAITRHFVEKESFLYFFIFLLYEIISLLIERWEMKRKNL